MTRTNTPAPTATGDLPEDWRLAKLAACHARSVLLDGLPGTGKSHLATLTREHPSGLPLDTDGDVYNLTLHEDATVGDVIGNYLPRAGKWDWRNGPAVDAWLASHDRPVRLVLNEVDQAAGAVLTALYAILDSPLSARLTLPSGDTVRPNPDNFQVISTMNGQASDLPAALADRHVAKVTVNNPHPDSILALPGIWQDTARGMSAASARMEGRGTTPRDWHALHALVDAGLALADAASMVWPADRAREVADHLLIAGASAAPTIRPKAAKAAKAATPTAGPSSGPEYRCPNGHGMDAYTDTDGVAYPDDSGDIWCADCGAFFNADSIRVQA